MQLRYVVAQIVPDLIRQEPINIGVLLQSEEWVDCKFISKIPKDWEIPEDVTQDVVHNIDHAWKQRLKNGGEAIYIPEINKHEEIKFTDKSFLEWIQKTYNKQLRFSGIRYADIEIKDAFGFDTFLEKLYSLFVSPKPRLRKPPVRSKAHTKLKGQFKQLKLFGDFIQEHRAVVGTFPWVVDFWYRYKPNGSYKEVAIDVADFGQKKYLDRVTDIFAVWNDLKYQREDVERVSVVSTVTWQDEQKKAIDMLKRSSDNVFILDGQEGDLINLVREQLATEPRLGQIFTRDQFFSDLKKIGKGNKEE